MRFSALKSKNAHTCSFLSHAIFGVWLEQEVCMSAKPCLQTCCVLMMTFGAPVHLPFSAATQTYHIPSTFLTPWGHALCLPLYIQSGWIPPTVLCPNPSWQRKQKNIKDPTVYTYIFYTVNSVIHTNGRGPLEQIIQRPIHFPLEMEHMIVSWRPGN